MPNTPWAPYCPRDADWCRSEFNWCQLPWCYVSAECPRKIPTRIWHGVASGPAVNSSMAWMASHFSYDTCLSTPDCYSRPFDAACPFDWVHSGWSTQQRCPYSWSDVCQCMYQGRLLPTDLYMNFPLDFPGKYQHLPNIAAYGTSCAAWDQVPGTPLHSSCKPGSNWTREEYNWCQVPWCYVHPSCPSSIATHLFEGSMTAFYSYDACGNAPDCYANSSVDSQAYCPYDPSGDKSYKIHKSRGCECIYQGRQLPSYFYMDFPLSDRGRYANLSLISIYGTTCAAWDQFPETPGFQYCPPDTDWCHSTNNWCQLPWCYVSASCTSKVETSALELNRAEPVSTRAMANLVDALHGEAWRAVGHLVIEKLRRKDGHEEVLKALGTIEKEGAARKTEAFDKFFESTRRARGEAIDAYLLLAPEEKQKPERSM
eukprot:s3717_g1.t1